MRRKGTALICQLIGKNHKRRMWMVTITGEEGEDAGKEGGKRGCSDMARDEGVLRFDIV
jgi:hypothetical protein